MRKHEAQGVNEVGSNGEESFPLRKGLAYQAEFPIFEIPQAAVNELRAGGRGIGSQIRLLYQAHAQPAPGGVPCDASAVDTAADDQDIEGFGAEHSCPGVVCWVPKWHALCSDSKIRGGTIIEFEHLSAAVRKKEEGRGSTDNRRGELRARQPRSRSGAREYPRVGAGL